MKIIMLFNYFDNHVYSRYQSQIESLAKECDELIIPFTRGNSPDIKIDNITFERYEYNKDLEKYRINKRGFQSIWRHLYCKDVAEYFSYLEGDVILGYSMAGWFQLIHTMLKDNLDIPLILRLRGDARAIRDIVGKLGNKGKYYWLKKIYNNWLEDKTFKSYDYIIPISNKLFNKAEKLGIDRNKISYPVGLGVDTEKFTIKEFPKRFTVGYIGRISGEKGIGFLVELMKQTPDIKYIVAGEKQIKVDFPDNVEYLGYISHQHIQDVYNRCTITIQTSRSEGISNSILESYACGRMVLSSDLAHDDSIPVHGYRLHHDMDTWKNMIYEFCHKDIEYFKRQSKYPRKWALTQTWDIWGKRMIQRIESVTNGTKKEIKLTTKN